MKYKIKYTQKKIKGGYIGMNSEAARQLKIPFKHKKPKHTIVIYDKLSKGVKRTTIEHEKAESYFVRALGMGRKKSHYNALRFEKLDKPFPQENIRRELKNMGFKIIW